jgi:hypothetical protein
MFAPSLVDINQAIDFIHSKWATNYPKLIVVTKKIFVWSARIEYVQAIHTFTFCEIWRF